MKSVRSICHQLFSLLGGLLVLLSANSVTFADTKSDSKLVNHVKVQAFADTEAIVPGKTLNLAVVFEPEEGWHLYWRSPGGTGMPTEVTWKVPNGFEVGRTDFPPPEVQVDPQTKDISWLLPHKAVLITPIRVPESAVAGNVTFEVAASWLACKKECIPGDVKLALSLPVVAKGASAKPANEDLFKNAIASYPTPAAKAEHVKITCTAQRDPIKPGDKFQFVLTAEIEAKHHMQSHTPFVEELIPAIIFLEPTDGFEFGEVIYPQPHERVDKFLGKLSEYEGKVQFKIPVELSKDADKSVRWVRGVLQSQICTDAGTCYPPVFSEFEIPVRIAGGPAPSKAFSFSRPNVEAGSGSPAKSEPTTDTHKSAESSAVEPAAKSTATSDAPPSSLSNRFFVSLNRFQDWLLTFGYAGALMVAFIGGFVLNLMPCVLPVISLKVLSFVRQAHEHRLRVFFLGLAYAAGILVFFGVLAVLFGKFGKGWGELAQYPQVNLVLAGVVTAFAMSLFGVFAVFTPRIINKLDEKVEGEGFSSAFATGVLATVLGTACTAPFLSAAIGAASRFTSIQGAGIFMMSGVGMAFPYVMLAANPKWLRFVPKPGKWMGVFEGLMGFLLLGTAIWLLNPLRGQIGDFGVLLSLVFLVLIALAVWIRGKIEWGASLQKKATLYTLSAVVLLLSWVIPFKWIATIDGLMTEKEKEEQLIAEATEARERQPQGGSPEMPSLTQRGELDWSKGIPWRRYKRERVLQDVKDGYTVFIDYTADWCINCKTILKVVIDTPEVIALMKQNKVIPYEADYTRPVQEIKEDLARYGRGGVPVQVVYKPNDPANPNAFQAFDQQTLLNALKEAGPSKANMMTQANP